ncbi:MAG TPA: TraM recognition domain-containing protein [Mycobacteriales bacterium]|jgi:hypothetical protein|nr:TraM recognition domain-containing protein [Mycobacteriales bacterium]
MTPAPLPSPPPAGPLARWLVDPAGEWSRLLHHLDGLTVVTAPRVALAGGALAGAVAAAAWLRRRQLARLLRGARQVAILSPPEVEPDGAAALWDNLHDLLRPRWRRLAFGQPHLAFEYVWTVEGLSISLWVPGGVPRRLVEQAVEAAWPGAKTEVTDPAPAPLPPGGNATGGELRLAGPGWYPLRTEHPADPLRALIGAVGSLHTGERAAVQVLARPATGRALARCRRAARDVRSGRPASRLGRALDLLPAPGSRAGRAPVDPAASPDVRSILAKAEGALWTGAVRYAVATDAERTPVVRRTLRGRAHALASAFALHSGRNRLERHRLRQPVAALASRRLGHGSLLSTLELAGLAHLPTDVAVVGLTRAGARSVPPPPAVPRDPAAGIVLGDADAGPERAVVLRAADARHHVHVSGTTGGGKSTLLCNVVLQNAEAGRGTVVIDPKGDLITDVLARMSPAQRRGAIVLDPQAPGAPPTLNMLEVPDGVDADLVVEHLIGIFRRIFQQHWGPRTDDVLRAACLTLLRHPPGKLGQVPRLLTDTEFLNPYLLGIEDNPVLGGFWAWYIKQSDAQRAQVVGPVLNKLRAFLLRGFVREVVDQPRSSIDMAEVLDGGLLLCRVPKGLLGDDTARLLGSFVVAKVWQAATGRAALGEAVRVDAALIVDEFQNFLTLPRSFDEMLAEARGYRLALWLAHQHLGQLSREVGDAISTNARTKLAFTCSPEDAHRFARHFAPELSEHDLAHLAAYQVAVRTVVRGEDQAAFTARTRPPRPIGPPAEPQGRAA